MQDTKAETNSVKKDILMNPHQKHEHRPKTKATVKMSKPKNSNNGNNSLGMTDLNMRDNKRTCEDARAELN